MKETALTLVPGKNNKKIRRIILLVFLLMILAVGIYFMITEFSIQSIDISGAGTYTDSEIIHAVQEEDYVPNTLVMILENRIFGQTYLPFVEHITMSYKKPHVLKIKVKEKLRAGVFQYMEKYVYFNSDGMAMESRNHLFEGVPVVTGVEFEKLVLGKRIPASEEYFRTILQITKKISTYGLDVSEIHFEDEDDITLTSGAYQIYLGSSSDLDDKMSKISSVLDSVSEKQKKGVIDLHLYTSEKNIITFHK